jgi:4-hydroxybenzoate polyprenyltransferase
LRPYAFSAAAAVLFGLVSSGIYALNDWRDRVADRLHPVKRLRPVASGEISSKTALTMSAGLLAAGILGSLFSPPLCAVISAYVALQLLYTFRLKHVPLVDVFVIAAGFVLRAVAGAAVLSARISPWLLLCTFLLALFLALCKRRQEKVTRHESEQRRSVRAYSTQMLDSLISITAAATIVSYSLYTLSSETVARFGTPLLGLTIPLVIFGVFRYLHLVYTSRAGERPEQVLLTDKAIIATIILYGLVVAGVFLYR